MKIHRIVTDKDNDNLSYLIVLLMDEDLITDPEDYEDDGDIIETPTGEFYYTEIDGKPYSYVRDYVEGYMAVIDNPEETPIEGGFSYDGDGFNFKDEKLQIILKQVLKNRGF